MNAKDEFLKVTDGLEVIAAIISFNDDIGWKSYNEINDDKDTLRLKPLYTQEQYNNFLTFLDRDYHNGYGGQELFGYIMCEKGVWFQRAEYDGSEWWEMSKYPDLRDYFNESDVIKYERFGKLTKLNKIF